MNQLSFEDQHRTVLEKFRHVFVGYVMKDIESLLSIKPDDHGYGRCAAQLAMTAFATMSS